MDFLDDFVVNYPLTFFNFLEGVFSVSISWFGSHYCYLVLPSLVCLNFLDFFSLSPVCLNFSGIVRIVFSCVFDRLKFAMLVDLAFRLV